MYPFCFLAADMINRIVEGRPLAISRTNQLFFVYHALALLICMTSIILLTLRSRRRLHRFRPV